MEHNNTGWSDVLNHQEPSLTIENNAIFVNGKNIQFTAETTVSNPDEKADWRNSSGVIAIENQTAREIARTIGYIKKT